MGALAAILNPKGKTVLAGLFSIWSIQVVKLSVWASLAIKLSVCVGKRGLAGWLTVMVAAWLSVAKRNTMGRSPWLCATSGATNKHKVSNCALDLNCVRQSSIKNKYLRG